MGVECAVSQGLARVAVAEETGKSDPVKSERIRTRSCRGLWRFFHYAYLYVILSKFLNISPVKGVDRANPTRTQQG